jgi:hypothetical protein
MKLAKSVDNLYPFCEPVTPIAQLLERLGVKVKRYYLRHLSIALVIVCLGLATVASLVDALELANRAMPSIVRWAKKPRGAVRG